MAAAPGEHSPAAAGSPAGDGYLRIRGLRKEFDGVPAVDDVDLTIARGECFVLLGASGCGKSTLLRLLAGFEQPTRGTVELDGEPLLALPPYRRPVNMMFQSYALFPHLTVAQNVAFGLRQDRLPRAEVAERTARMLELVQLAPLASRRPHQLSGGQQQRVALARSLAKRPKLLLLDEPMAALDRRLRLQMQLELAALIARVGVTCVMVTHDQEEAMTMAHRIAVMDAGRVCQVGTPAAIYERPNSRFTAGFVGSVNLLEGRVAAAAGGIIEFEHPLLAVPARVACAADAGIGAAVALALRPEQLRVDLSEPPQRCNKVAGRLEEIAYLGSRSLLHVVLADGSTLRVEAVNGVGRGPAPARQQPVWVYWHERDGVVLTA